MKLLIYISCCCLLGACGPGFKMAVPEQFTSQATRLKVEGSRSRYMKLGDYATSRIKRGMHLAYPGWGRGFFLENLLLNQLGLRKSEIVNKEKTRFSFSIHSGGVNTEVFAREFQVQRNLRYELNNNSLFRNPLINGYEQLQEFDYIFSASITTDSTTGPKTWELLMRSYYNRKDDTAKKLFTLIPQGDAGIASNGVDTIIIRPLLIQQTEGRNGKTGKLPFKMVTGYELRIEDGVIAVIDAVEKSVWVYNELDAPTRLVCAAITTAIMARKVKDVKW